MVSGALIRTLVFLFLGLLFILFDTLVDFLDLFFFVL